MNTSKNSNFWLTLRLKANAAIWRQYDPHVRLDVSWRVEINDIIPTRSREILDAVENASENVDAENRQKQQLYRLENGGSKVHHGIIFHLPENAWCQDGDWNKKWDSR
jgi:hypothetical protein